MKILVVRFSSIGDIVLTSPVLRNLSEQLEGVEIHYLTKRQYAGLVMPNPHVNKVHVLKEDFSETIQALKSVGFDLMIDLHNNLRTRRLSLLLQIPYKRVDKENGKKLRMVFLKDRKLKNRHIVDRYMDTCRSLGISNDEKGLDFFFPSDFDPPSDLLPETIEENFVAMAIGGQHFTKKMTPLKLVELAQKIESQIVILGGPEDAEVGQQMAELCSNVTNVAGKTSLNESAYLIQKSQALITHDTGMMHIAAALKKDVYSIWGNTIPEFGMNPYKAGINSQKFQVKGLACRPCSKIGYDKCPAGHFKCMEEQDLDAVAEVVNG